LVAHYKDIYSIKNVQLLNLPAFFSALAVSLSPLNSLSAPMFLPVLGQPLLTVHEIKPMAAKAISSKCNFFMCFALSMMQYFPIRMHLLFFT
jgi:hypothetical protein